MKRRLHLLTSTDTLIMGVLLVLAAFAFAPDLRVRFLVAREDAIARDLEDLGARLDDARLTSGDRDRDGRTEYPTLSAAFASEAFATRAEQFEPVEGHPEVFQRYGYYFALYLPDRNRRPVPAADPTIPADYAEASYLLIAWPVEPGSTGFRAYLRTPVDGVLRHGIDGYPYGGPDGPPVPREDMVDLRDGRVVAMPLRTRHSQRWISPRPDAPITRVR